MTKANMPQQEEIWKSIIGYEGYYEVSNMGRVRSLDRTIYRETPLKSFSFYSYKGMILSKRLSKKGYIYVALCKNNKPKTIRVGRLVASHFVENPNNKQQVNHIDGNRCNDVEGNLEWVTHDENQQHSWKKLGRQQSGVKKRPVASYLNGVEVKRYCCICHVSKDGFVPASVCSVLSGRRKTHGGLGWAYLD